MGQQKLENEKECYWCDELFSNNEDWEVTREGEKVHMHCLEEIAGIALQEECSEQDW